MGGGAYKAKGRSILVFIDDATVTPISEHQQELEYNAMASGAVKGVYCSHLSWREQLRSTSYIQCDYTFKNPPHHLQHKHRAGRLNGVPDAYPVYDYPGRYKHDDAGKPFTRAKLEATRVDASTGEGFANAPHLSAGHRFALTDHPNEALNAKYLVLSVKHSGRQPQALGLDAVAPPTFSDPLNPFGLVAGAPTSTRPCRWPAKPRRCRSTRIPTSTQPFHRSPTLISGSSKRVPCHPCPLEVPGADWTSPRGC